MTRMSIEAGRKLLKGKRLTTKQKKIRDTLTRVYKRKDGITTLDSPHGRIAFVWRNIQSDGKLYLKKGTVETV